MRPPLRAAPFLLLAVAGCQNVKTVGGVSNPHPIGKVVSLSPGATEVAAINLGVRVIGITASDNYPPSLRGAPIVMYGTKPDYEKVAALKPDAIVYSPDLFSPADLAKFQELHIPAYPIGGKNLDEFKQSIYRVADLTGGENFAEEYISNIEKALSDVASHYSGGNGPKVAVMLAGQGGEHWIAGANSFQADILKQAGVTPVGPAADRFVPANLEDLVKQNPDIILVAGGSTDVFNVGTDPKLAATNAVKKKNVFGIPPDMVEREGARVDQFVKDIGVALEKAQ